MKRWYYSRTLWLNALLIPLVYWIDRTDLVSIDPTWLLVGVLVANLLLRLVTTQPILWRPQ